tara:strand:+ start:17167 stop:18978 length:1812 start_codon:yes stop_codon:yes gene_type:complete
MAKKFTPPIDYTSRDFNSIKNSLVSYARKYYPNTANDFNDASFGSMMIDMVSYVGDILSFYVDYQASESFLDSAIEFKNVLRLAQQMGYKYDPEITAVGSVAIFIKVPAASNGLGPDTDYIPTLKRNTRFSSNDNVTFILTTDVDFASSNAQVLVSDVDATTGNPTFYAVKAYGAVISGDIGLEEITIGDWSPFQKYELDVPDLAEIIQVTDSEGNVYFEVDYLSQDTVYVDVPNTDSTDRDFVPQIMKAVSVPRRFLVERDSDNNVFLQFGQGAATNEIFTNDAKLNPNNVALQMHGKDYISDTSFDPTVLIKNNNLGVAPENTTLTVIYRANLTQNINIGVGSISNTYSVDFSFPSPQLLDESKIHAVVQSAEVSNEEIIASLVNDPDADEIKIRARNNFTTQNRAVTKQDYISLAYALPPKFGVITRATIRQDRNSFKRNLNMFVVSEGLDGTLLNTKRKIKVNLKNWLQQYKMLNDTVDIIDAKILNLGISYKAIADSNINKIELIQDINESLLEIFSTPPEIGESFFITDVYNVINGTPGVVDTSDVEIFVQRGGVYSDFSLNLDLYTSPDGRYIEVPQDVIWEIKFINNDIQGTIIK